MFKRRRTASSFGPDGRRIDSKQNTLGTTTTIVPSIKRPLVPLHQRPRNNNSLDIVNKCNSNNTGGKKFVATFGKKVNIQRAPIMGGLSVSVGCAGVLKPFQRPMLGRRAYKGKEDEALRNSSLGPRRSLNGMQRLLARAGKGLDFSSKQLKSSGDGTDDSSDEDDKKDERPFEPLMVWESPHQGGEAKGLPGTRYVL
jgi:hypothetical protein